MPILIVGALLSCFGILAVYSVSIHESFTLTLSLVAKGLRSGEPSNYFYFFRQLRNVFMAVIAAGALYYIPISFFQKSKNIIIIFSLFMILQLAVFVPGIGVTLNGARWWINMPLLWSMQPAEFFKVGYVLFLAWWLIRKRSKINQKEFYISFIVLNAAFFLVFLMIPDLGTVLILWLVGLILCRYAWSKLKYVLMIVVGWLSAGLIVGSIAGMVSPRFQYIQKRFTYFLSSSVDPQNRQVGWQNQQALIAVGWGWFLGKWYGKWLQKFGFIPEAQSDFVFAAFSEEIGFAWNIVLLGLYFYLAYYFLSRLRQVRDEYGKMIGVGIISLIMIQVFVNIGVNIKIMPNTWLTLPFVSYGGTALMVNLIEIMLLYKILKNR